MNFNNLIKVLEDFYTPVDAKRPTLKSGGKFGTINPQLNEPHNTNSISGFKGQPGGKKYTLKFYLPSRRNPLRRSKRSS